MVRDVCVGEVHGGGVEVAEEEPDSGRDTDVMTTCGTPYSWCRTRMACSREAESVILTPERSLRQKVVR